MSHSMPSRPLAYRNGRLARPLYPARTGFAQPSDTGGDAPVQQPLKRGNPGSPAGSGGCRQLGRGVGGGGQAWVAAAALSAGVAAPSGTGGGQGQ